MKRYICSSFQLQDFFDRPFSSCFLLLALLKEKWDKNINYYSFDSRDIFVFSEQGQWMFLSSKRLCREKKTNYIESSFQIQRKLNKTSILTSRSPNCKKKKNAQRQLNVSNVHQTCIGACVFHFRMLVPALFWHSEIRFLEIDKDGVH